MINEVDDKNRREDFRARQCYSLESEKERARHKVFYSAIENFNAKFVDEKLDQFFINSKCAAKVNRAIEFICKNIEAGKFRYFYAHKHKILLD